MTYAFPASELATVTYLLKLQPLQNKIVGTFGNFPRCTPVRDLNTAFNRPYVYDYITKLCRLQAEVVKKHENDHVHSVGQGEARHKIYKMLKLGSGQAYDRSSD
jgi:hypothetical protein